jgi:hypothetical protein
MATIFRSFRACSRRVRSAFHRAMAEKRFTVRSHAANLEHSSETTKNDVSGSLTIQATSPYLTNPEIHEYRNYRELQRKKERSKTTSGKPKIGRRSSRKYAPYAAVVRDIKITVADYSDPAVGSTPRKTGPQNSLSKPRYRRQK